MQERTEKPFLLKRSISARILSLPAEMGLVSPSECGYGEKRNTSGISAGRTGTAGEGEEKNICKYLSLCV